MRLQAKYIRMAEIVKNKSKNKAVVCTTAPPVKTRRSHSQMKIWGKFFTWPNRRITLSRASAIAISPYPFPWVALWTGRNIFPRDFLHFFLRYSSCLNMYCWPSLTYSKLTNSSFVFHKCLSMHLSPSSTQLGASPHTARHPLPTLSQHCHVSKPLPVWDIILVGSAAATCAWRRTHSRPHHCRTHLAPSVPLPAYFV